MQLKQKINHRYTKYTYFVRESYPIDRASSMTNSRVYFCHIVEMAQILIPDIIADPSIVFLVIDMDIRLSV